MPYRQRKYCDHNPATMLDALRAMIQPGTDNNSWRFNPDTTIPRRGSIPIQTIPRRGYSIVANDKKQLYNSPQGINQ